MKRGAPAPLKLLHKTLVLRAFFRDKLHPLEVSAALRMSAIAINLNGITSAFA